MAHISVDPAEEIRQLHIFTGAVLKISRVLTSKPNRRKMLERMETTLLDSGDWRRRPGWQRPRRMLRGQDLGLWHARKASRPKCGARTRAGTPCKAPVVWGRTRCRLHGGCSTGPKTEAGRQRIAESNRRRAQIRRQAQAGKTR